MKLKNSIFREYIEFAAKFMIFVFFLHTFLLQSYVIPSSSMENSMLIGDHLLVDKVRFSRSYNSIDAIFLPQVPVERGTIIAFSGPNEINLNLEAKSLVKRVVALPGETIKIIDNRVYINSIPLEEPYACFKGYGQMINFPPKPPRFWPKTFPEKLRSNLVYSPIGVSYKVPDGHFFCLGDNRNDSFDSRFWGPVPGNLIIGRPWRVYWSFASESSDYLGNQSMSHSIKNFLHSALHFFSKTRWERTFMKY
jgi:signal peptidase I